MCPLNPCLDDSTKNVEKSVMKENKIFKRDPEKVDQGE
jgi:hypothetical protein